MGKFSRLGNDLYNGKRSVDFVGRRWLWYAISAVLLIICISGLALKGLNMGIEFTGGAEYRVTLPSSQVTQDTADELRESVAGAGVDNASSPVVSTSGTEAILIQTEPLSGDEGQTIADVILETTGAQPDDLSQTEIGASWGQQVAERALIGLAVFLVLVVLFIWAYFRQWKMSVAALVALAHDVVITIGVYAMSGFEVTPASVTGVLTILGFSLYDTVVVFDKVRENTADMKANHQTYSEASNLAVNQTLVRSINTSIVALIPVACILYVGAFLLGASSLKDLALALFVGMAAGVYSSVFIATPLLVHLKSNESEVVLAERREKARRRAQADKYASVPAFTDDLPVRDQADEVVADGEDEPEQRPMAPTRVSEASGRGRVAPPARGPVGPSGAAGRVQPSRQTRAKRGKK